MREHEAWISTEDRRSDLDWLRVIATFGVFLLHCLKFFDPLDWEVKNNVSNTAVLIPILFLIQWLMPLFVLLSGASIYLALRRKRIAFYIGSRFLRLLLPYMTVGLFLIIPPQEYARYVSHGGAIPAEGLLALVIRYAREIRILGTSYPWLTPPQMHLWYLLWLFVFTMAMLPLVLMARTFHHHADQFAAWARTLLARPGAIFLFCLPLAGLISFLDPLRPEGDLTSYGGWPLLAYPLFLVLGYCTVALDGFEDALIRHRRTALILALLSLPFFIAAALALLGGASFQFGSSGFVVLCFLRVFNAWALLIALLGYGITTLRFSNRFLQYATEATLPFYIIHQTVIVLIGYAIASDATPWGYKLVFLAVLSFLTTMIVYDLLVRRLNIVRFFFGMKRRRRAQPTAAAAAVIAMIIILDPAAALSASRPGLSGRIEAGAAKFAVSDHLSTDDSPYLDGLDSVAVRQDEIRTAVFFQIRYRTSGGSEIYFGIPYDTRELPLEAGLDLPVKESSQLKFNATFVKDFAWKDPFLVGTRRAATGYIRQSVSASYARVIGSMLSMTYRIDRFDVKEDELGDRLPNLGRDGIGHSLNIEYAFEPLDGTTIVPKAGIGKMMMTGEANSANSVMAGLAMTRSSGNMVLRLQADVSVSSYDAPHPLFGKAVESTNTCILLVIGQGHLFGDEHVFANVFAGSEQRRTNVVFLDARKQFAGITIGYRF